MNTVDDILKRNARIDVIMATLLGLVMLFFSCASNPHESCVPNWLQTIIRMMTAIVGCGMGFTAIGNWMRVCQRMK